MLQKLLFVNFKILKATKCKWFGEINEVFSDRALTFALYTNEMGSKNMLLWTTISTMIHVTWILMTKRMMMTMKIPQRNLLTTMTYPLLH